MMVLIIGDRLSGLHICLLYLRDGLIAVSGLMIESSGSCIVKELLRALIIVLKTWVVVYGRRCEVL